MKNIGVLGGSFDPVHLGHLSLAKDALIQGKLDSVIFMPAYRQPFKLQKQMSSDIDRLAMLREAVATVPAFEVSDWEIQRKGISYTYLTLRGIRLNHPESKLFFITGTDTFLKIHLWKNADELLRENSFIIGHRPGYRDQELLSRADELRGALGIDIRVISNTRLDISSTGIRRRVSMGEPISTLVPESVERYIVEHGLYL